MQIEDIQDNLSKYRRLGSQRNILIFLLLLLIPLSLWGIDERRRERAMYERLVSTNELGASAQYWTLYYESNSGFDEQVRERFQDERNMISFPYGVAMLFTYLIFLMWLYDCRKNTELWAIDFKYGPKWIILGILIPIANLILPALVITEIWKASNPKLTTYANPLWRKSSASLLIVIWWLTYILLKAGNREPYPENRQSLADYIASTNADIQSYSFTIPVAVLTIAVVWALTRRQEAKYRAIQALANN
jgi:hypothetical protein